MELRRYRSSDCKGMAELFYDTVHSVNRRDYTPEQLDAWADGNVDLMDWDRSFQEHFTVVAEIHGCLAGFGDMDRDGYLDRLYVSRDHQGQGVAAAICRCLEQWIAEQRCGGGIHTEAAEMAPAADVAEKLTDQAVPETGETCLVTTHASITARPFFEKRGYRVIKEQQVERRGQRLTNYVMVKNVHSSDLRSRACWVHSGHLHAMGSERGEGI